MEIGDLLFILFMSSAALHFALRPIVIDLLHHVGAFQSFGAPRTYFHSDALPARVLSLQVNSVWQKALVVSFFITWVLFLTSGFTSLVLFFND